VATDLDLSIRTKGEAEVSEEGAITVSSKRIGEIVRELPDAPVTVTVKESKVNLKCANDRFHSGREPGGFSQLPQMEAGKAMSSPPRPWRKACGARPTP